MRHPRERGCLRTRRPTPPPTTRQALHRCLVRPACRTLGPMKTEARLAAKFWKSLRSDRTVMLGLVGADEGHTQPMTALVDGDEDAGPIWIFSARDVSLVRALGGRRPAVMHFASKD